MYRYRHDMNRPEGVTPAGQVAKSGSAADTDSSTTLDL